MRRQGQGRRGGRLRQIATISLGLALALSGCSTPSADDPAASAETGETATTDETLTIGWSSVTVYNIHGYSGYRNNVWRTISDSLVYRSSDGEYSPWLATQWESSDDELVWTFSLRDDVTFQDGAPFNAEAVKLNFDKQQDPDYVNADNIRLLRFLQETEVVDEYTVRFHLSEPVSNWLHILSTNTGAQISPASFEHENATPGGVGVYGTGPYILTEVIPNQELVFERFDDYDWAPEVSERQGAAAYATVKVQELIDPQVRLGALTSGQVDLINDVPANQWDEYAEHDDYTLEWRIANAGITRLNFNVGEVRPDSPIADQRVRRALVQGIDVDTIIDSVFGDSAVRHTTDLSPYSADYDAADAAGVPGFDLEAAKRLLDEAGWSSFDAEGYRTKDGQRLSLELPVSVTGAVPEYILGFQDQARINAGIEVVIQALDSGTYSEVRSSEEYDLLFAGHGTADTVENLYYLYDFASWTNVSDARLLELIATISTTTDNDALHAAIREVEDIALKQEVYASAWYFPKNSRLASDSVGGVENSFTYPTGSILDLYQLYPVA